MIDVTVNKAALLKALNALIPLMDRSPVMPLAYVKISTSGYSRLMLSIGGVGRGIFENLIHAEHIVPARVEDGGSVCVDMKAFKALVSSCKKGDISIVYHDSARPRVILYQNDLDVGDVETHEEHAFHSAPGGGSKDVFVFTVDAQALKQGIDAVSYASAKSDNRPILTGVSLRSESSTLAMAAADGFQLAASYTPINVADTGRLDVVLPEKRAKQIATLLKDASGTVIVVVDRECNRITLNWGDMMLTTLLLEGRYPDYAAILADEYCGSAVVDAQAWHTAIKAFPFVVEDILASVTHQFAQAGLMLTQKNSQTAELVPLIEMTDTRMFPMFFDGAQLMPALAAINEICTVSFHEHKLTFTTRHATHVVMGMRN